jgi:hypothetical protein
MSKAEGRIINSCFDKSVCCVCTQSLWGKCEFNRWLWGFIVIFTIIGTVLNCVYYAEESKIIDSKSEEYLRYKLVGWIFHFGSLGMAFLLSLYPGRYLSKFQHDEPKDADISHTVCTYIMCCFYAFFIFLVYMPRITDFSSDEGLVDRCAEGIVINYSSILVLWFINVVF